MQGLISGNGAYHLVTVKRNGASYDGAMHFEGKDQLYLLVRAPTNPQAVRGTQARAPYRAADRDRLCGSAGRWRAAKREVAGHHAVASHFHCST
jgi:hypothetical protein